MWNCGRRALGGGPRRTRGRAGRGPGGAAGRRGPGRRGGPSRGRPPQGRQPAAPAGERLPERRPGSSGAKSQFMCHTTDRPRSTCGVPAARPRRSCTTSRRAGTRIAVSSASVRPARTLQMIQGRLVASSPAAPRRTSGSVDSVSTLITWGRPRRPRSIDRLDRHRDRPARWPESGAQTSSSYRSDPTNSSSPSQGAAPSASSSTLTSRPFATQIARICASSRASARTPRRSPGVSAAASHEKTADVCPNVEHRPRSALLDRRQEACQRCRPRTPRDRFPRATG